VECGTAIGDSAEFDGESDPGPRIFTLLTAATYTGRDGSISSRRDEIRRGELS
jgi:hypothetical protein